MFLGKHHVALGLYRLDLLEKQFKAIELAANLRLQMLRQWTAVAGLELFQPLPPGQRRVIGASVIRKTRTRFADSKLG